VAIDWDQAMKLGTAYLDLGFPMMALLTWLMSRQQIGMRLLWLCELLERDLTVEFSRIWNPKWPKDRYPTLRDWESEAMRSMTNANLRSLNMVNSVRATFRHHFRGVTTDVGRLSPESVDLLRKFYGRDPDWQKRFSVLSMRSAPEAVKMHRGPVEPVGTSHPSFRDLPDAAVNPIAYELAFLYHCNNAVEQGALKINEQTPYGPHPETFLVVHMGKYAEYRSRTGAQYFKDYKRKNNLTRHKTLSLGPRFVDEFIKAYPKLYNSNMHTKFSKKRADSRFHLDVKHEDLWVVKLSDLRELLEKRKQMTAAREGTVPELPRKRNKPAPPQPFLLESPPFKGLNNHRMEVWIVRWYGKTYYCPSWTIPEEYLYATKERTLKKLKPGVMVIEDNFYVTMPILVEAGVGDIHRCDEARGWLEGVDLTPDHKISNVQRMAKLRTRQRYGEKIPVSLTRTPFTEDEKQLILNNYRPEMTQKNIDDLLARMPGRSWKAVQRKATEMCKEMIENGILDFRLLPHRRLSSKMYAMIQQKIEESGGKTMLVGGEPIKAKE
jgi:hypothetical protein